MQTQPATGVLHFRGRPQDLIGVFGAPPDAPRTVIVHCRELPGMDGSVQQRARMTHGPEDGLVTLRLKLRPTTRPGRYECTLHDGEEWRLGVIEVEPYPRTRLLSYHGDVTGVPDSEHTLTTTVINLGNVALEVTPSASVRLTDGDLIDAVLSAVSAQSDSDERLRAFADGLASGDGGTVELAVAEGTGKLDPGETRELSVSFRMPSGLRPRRTYVGHWRIGETRYALRLHCEGEEPVRKGRRPRSSGPVPKAAGTESLSAPAPPGSR